MRNRVNEALRDTTEPRFQADWTRQRRTANDILQRLENQEGVVLADQVGMGKTYVALTVAVSQILSTAEPGHVVVFVPPAVADKWVREWHKFSETLLDPRLGLRCVDRPIRSGEDFLKALDDPPERRKHLIVVAHTALTATLKDSFVRLALLHYATRYRRDGADLRRRIARWSTQRSGLIQDNRFTSERVSKLLDTPTARWRDAWQRMTGDGLDDDPVPAALDAASRQLAFDDLRSVLEALPIRSSADISRRLERARRELASVTQSTWRWILSSTDLDLPLLIVDEAHRLKNDYTQISRLFAERSDDDASAGALTGLFRRMLFLTATPFELGHSELINVLSRMGAVRPLDPGPDRPLAERLDALKRVLTTAQASALSFDAAWGRLDEPDLPAFDAWTPTATPPGDMSVTARECWVHGQLAARTRADMHDALRPWVIRHQRPHRRSYRPGRLILADGELGTAGLDIPESASLPFLLAARAQSVAVDEGGPVRPLFAYGIASSFEAFGRLGSGAEDEGLDSDSPAEDRPAPTSVVGAGNPRSAVTWYRDEIERALADAAVRESHPKVGATVDKALQLWLQSEKCLIFCWFIRTGAAVDRALATRVDDVILERAGVALHLHNNDSTRAELDRLADRLFRRDSSSYERLRNRLRRALADSVVGHDDVLDLVTDVVIRHMRTPSYLVRYTPLTPDLDDAAVWAGINGDNPGSLKPLGRWQDFASRLTEARKQIIADGTEIDQDSEFGRIGSALLGARGTDDATGRGASLHPVRRASGQTDRRTRERLISLFNTPFAPELLVASSVMGEGIDLHQQCRYVIHHDLDWNPSVLEQRTGRLDRIGALAEREDKNIQVFEPYLAGTHDEKMFRVVKDRGQWFDVVMGRPSAADELTTDREESRLPLHESIRAALTMDLTSRG